ncbi:PQQ-dependent sugar dehydrogenase [Halorubrum sp. JWXQ-INN 858]|uniref:PQQ-dependent sugar dehydrogenase n=1 Tax=Halorubrum sp. JWXQ-INN 858 TaxID=2690782 RepID=UPI00190F6E04|nr:PQQ-dependent sugar dehydrogenase [Halorubrum sp. JWXQ-INN 858]
MPETPALPSRTSDCADTCGDAREDAPHARGDARDDARHARGDSRDDARHARGDSRDDARHARRDLLRRAAAVGTVGVLGTAGCLGNGADGGSSVSGGSGGSGGPSGSDGEGAGDGATGDDGSDQRPYAVETVVDGLERPWGLAFLPDGDGLLVTERRGTLRLVDVAAGTTRTVGGTPDVAAAGQGGLLDVALGPAFSEEPWVYLTFSASNGAGETTTCLGRGRLDGDPSDDGTEPSLAGFETAYVAEPFVDSTGHYGSRVVFGRDGMAYVTVGDRQFKDFGPEHVSQDPSNDLGAVLRLEPDGAVPADNPFVDDPAVSDAVYAYGLRNTQGLTVHPGTGDLWASEHGERDGDSITVIERGGNHGWPVAHYGCAYGTDAPVGDRPDERDDVVDPVHYWECGSGGFPPAGMTVYRGDAFPAWEGDLFVGTLAGGYLGRFGIEGYEGAVGGGDVGGGDGNDGDRDAIAVTEREALLAGEGWRVRDVAVAPDTGFLYVAIDDADVPLLRLVPR